MGEVENRKTRWDNSRIKREDEKRRLKKYKMWMV